MGGKALKQHTSVRLQRQDYFLVAAECIRRLRSAGVSDVRLIGSFKEKKDFGDCDLLVVMPDFDIERVREALEGREVVDNGPVASVAVPIHFLPSFAEGDAVFQVDVIHSTDESIDFHEQYCSASDAGNLLSKAAATMGLTLRHDGLVAYQREAGFKFHEILLTTDFARAMSAIGYDSTAFSAGFANQEAAFEYLSGGRYFNADVFTAPPKNSAQRRKRALRPMFNEFALWCQARPSLPKVAPRESDACWFDHIETHFPGFKEALAAGDAIPTVNRLEKTQTRLTAAGN